MPDNGNFDAATFIEFVGREILGGFVPFCIKDVLAKGGKRQIADNVAYAIRTQRELPVERHRIRLQQVHDIHDILSLGFVAGVGAVPCVTPIQQQCVRTVSADTVHDSRDPIHTAHFSIGLPKSGEIIIGQRIV